MGAHPELSVSRLRRWTAVVAGAALAAGFAVFGGVASAAPGVPQRPAASPQQKLDKLISQDDKLGAQYDQSLASLAAARATLKAVNRQIGRDQRTFQALRGQVGRIAATAYETGNETSVTAVLASSDPQRVLEQAGMLQHLSSVRYSAMKAYLAAASSLRGAQVSAQRAQAAITQLVSQKAAQKHALDKAVTKQKALVARLTSAVQPGAGATTAGPVPSVSGAAGAAVRFAFAQIGKPYVWGATGPDSYDCSGLVMKAWAAAGVSIPRDTYQQWAALPHVPQSAIQPGDLMFYDAEGHVAMYVGGGKLIDAPQPGQNVEEISMSDSWYASNFDGAARP